MYWNARVRKIMDDEWMLVFNSILLHYSHLCAITCIRYLLNEEYIWVYRRYSLQHFYTISTNSSASQFWYFLKINADLCCALFYRNVTWIITIFSVVHRHNMLNKLHEIIVQRDVCQSTLLFSIKSARENLYRITSVQYKTKVLLSTGTEHNLILRFGLWMFQAKQKYVFFGPVTNISLKFGWLLRTWEKRKRRTYVNRIYL